MSFKCRRNETWTIFELVLHLEFGMTTTRSIMIFVIYFSFVLPSRTFFYKTWFIIMLPTLIIHSYYNSLVYCRVWCDCNRRRVSFFIILDLIFPLSCFFYVDNVVIGITTILVDFDFSTLGLMLRTDSSSLSEYSISKSYFNTFMVRSSFWTISGFPLFLNVNLIVVGYFFKLNSLVKVFPH